MEEESQRFNIEEVEYDKDGNPVIPRISFSVPKLYRKEFLQDMLDEVRTTPGEQLMAIFVVYYRWKRAKIMAATKAQSEASVQSDGRLPSYGPKTSKLEIGQTKVRSGDEG